MRRSIFAIIVVVLIAIGAYLLISEFGFNPKYGKFQTKELNFLAEMLLKGQFENAENLTNKSKFSLDEISSKGTTLLYFLIKKNNFEAFQWLLIKGANPNLLFDKRTDSVMRQVSEHENQNYLRVALKYGGKANLLHYDGQSPLFYACNKNRLANIEILINEGDDGNFADEYNNTTITRLLALNKFDKINFLLSKGLNPKNSKNDVQRSIVFYIEMRYANLSQDLMIEFLRMVENLKALGFKFELLDVKEYLKRADEKFQNGPYGEKAKKLKAQEGKEVEPKP